MTTSIKVTAHCSADKEVHIEVSDATASTVTVLQDTETKEFLAYDDRVISVREVKK